MSDTKLKTCPFCGGEVKYYRPSHHMEHFVNKHTIYCELCNFMMEDVSALKLMNKWNQRKPMDDIVEKLQQQAEQYRQRAFGMENKNISTLTDKYYRKQCSYLHAIEIVKEAMQDE